MNSFKKARIAAAAVGLALLLSQASQAQALNSNNSTVALNAVLAESLTVSATPGIVNFTLASTGTSTGSAPVAITTTWALGKTRTSVKVFAYFSGTTALTDGSGDNIPTSNVLGAVGVGAYAPFTGGSAVFNVNSIQVANQAIGAAGTFNSSRTDNLSLEIVTTGLALPAATYTGTLNVQAQAL
jgi:hypothetical protein